MGLVPGSGGGSSGGSISRYRPVVQQLGSQQITTIPVSLTGWSINETTKTGDSELDIWDGNPSAGGTFIATVNLGANESDTRDLTNPWSIKTALWVVNSFGPPAGNAKGSMFTVP